MVELFECAESRALDAATQGRCLVLAVAMVVVSLASAGAFAQSPPSRSQDQASTVPQLFVERARELGIDVEHHSGATGKLLLPEIMGAGAALFDYDRDGDLDLYLVNSGELVDADHPQRLAEPGARTVKDRLFRNDLVTTDGLSDRGTLAFTDVTEAVRLDARGYGLGVAVGDVNGDGWQDLYLTNLGPNQLWLNRQGRFERVESGAEDPRWSSSATLFDADQDGDLDLYVANYARWSPDKTVTCFAPNSRRDYCGPQSYPPEIDAFFVNDGSGRFAALDSQAIKGAPGSGLGVVAFDATGNGSLDLLVANDGMANRLWLKGQSGWTDDGLLSGLAVNGSGSPEASMGVVVGDLDNDGDEDVFMTHLSAETDTLLLNQGGGLFVDRTVASHLASATMSRTSFGTAMIDVDGDGLDDLVVTSGAVRLGVESGGGGSAALGQANLLLRNTAQGSSAPRFAPLPPESAPGFAVELVSRGLAVGDLDNDGDADLVVTNADGPAQVFVNQTDPAVWVGLAISAPAGSSERVDSVSAGGFASPPLLGAVVSRTAGQREATKVIRTDGSYLSASDPRVRYSTLRPGDTIQVAWPPGPDSGSYEITITDRHLGRFTEWAPDSSGALLSSEQAKGARP